MSEDEHRSRWAGTARTAVAGTVLGAVGGAVTGTSTLLGDAAFSTGAAALFGGGFGAVLGALFGAGSGAVGGCLAVHLARRHALLARVVLALCTGVLIGVAARWSLPPGTHLLQRGVLAGGVAAAAAWLSAPWCCRPLRLPTSSAS
ncbi:hypothetical protein [Kineococcus indalonis]|uniref:hypothetical protein n=1 Tax=Kineococcus indalonis TaxID=2696566 RepID=UPI00141242AF|nr:hypothetical protein [Kineococcus indalonis]NAZ84651.1 hypothetical protein [Kineococcus indalonis]